MYKNGQWSENQLSNMNKSIQLILVYAKREILESMVINTYLNKHYPEAILVSCSTSGEINQISTSEDTAVCVLLSFDNTPQKFAFGNVTEHQDSFHLGQFAAKQLPLEDLTYVMVVSDGNMVNGDELLAGIQSYIDKKILITGGMAGDGDSFSKTVVGFKDDIREGNLVLIGFYGDKIKVGCSSKGGWDVYGPERTITKSKGNVLYEIDGESALELYKKYLGKYADGLPSSALLFPLSIRTSEEEQFVVRTILSIDEENGSMTFAGNLPEGSVARFMKSNFDRLISAASDAGAIAAESLGKDIDTNLALLVSCVGRKIVLADRVDEEVEAAVSSITPGATIAGYFSYGEIAPQRMGKLSKLHNQTITITTFAELN
jgi:hypothetical protein